MTRDINMPTYAELLKASADLQAQARQHAVDLHLSMQVIMDEAVPRGELLLRTSGAIPSTLSARGIGALSHAGHAAHSQLA
jgi:hypothetical protein